MKHKFKTFLFILALTFSFTLNVNAETTIKENANTYDSDVFIIGSSRFDGNVIVNGTMATVAGARESYIQYMIYQNYEFNPEDVRIYYYSELEETWSRLPLTSNDKMTELTEEETKELTENLNIYYVNEEEKVLEMPYNVNLEEGYELEFVANNKSYNDKIKYENGKLTIPASVSWIDVYAIKNSETEGQPQDKLPLASINQEKGSFDVQSSIIRSYEELTTALENETNYIEIIKSIDFPTAVEISNKIEIYLDHGVELTLENDTAGDGVFHVVEGGDLTIDGPGTLNGVGKNKYNLVIFAEAGKVTLNGGTYTNIETEIMDEDTDSNHFDVIYAKGTAQVIINGGYFEGKTPEWILNVHNASRNTASIKVNGGSFLGFNPSTDRADDNGAVYVAENHKVTLNNNMYTVSELDEDDVATIGFTAYTELNDAVNAATANDVIKLQANIDLPTAVKISKKITLDLNNHNLTLTKDTAGDGVFHVIEGGDLTIDGPGTLNGVGKNKYNLVIFAEAGKVTLNGGTYTNIETEIMDEDTDSNHFDVIYAKGTAQVIINGGYFEGKTPEWILNVHNASRNTASIKVNGGSFLGFNPSTDREDDNGSVYVAEGYTVVESENTYTVTKAN